MGCQFYLALALQNSKEGILFTRQNAEMATNASLKSHFGWTAVKCNSAYVPVSDQLLLTASLSRTVGRLCTPEEDTSNQAAMITCEVEQRLINRHGSNMEVPNKEIGF
jgi:hypothetical protein